jgi:hypothetical protein
MPLFTFLVVKKKITATLQGGITYTVPTIENLKRQIESTYTVQSPPWKPQPDADTKNERARFPYRSLFPVALAKISGSESRNVLLHNTAAALRAADQRQSRRNAQGQQIWCRRPVQRRHPAAEAAREGFFFFLTTNDFISATRS